MKKVNLLMPLLFLVLLLSSCSPGVSDGQKPVSTGPSEVKPEVETPSESKDETMPTTIYNSDFPVNFDFLQIYDKFMEEHAGSEVREFELVLEKSGYVYHIEAKLNQEEIESKYDASSGGLLELEREQDLSNKMIFTRDDLNFIPNFLDLVITDAGENYYLKEIVLQEDNGKKVIEIEVINDKNHDIEYKYDFMTQELIEKDQ